MKNANVEKINTIGKVTKIILIIMNVAFIAGIVGCLIGAVILGVMPKKDLVTGSGTISAQVDVADDGKLVLVDKSFIQIGSIDISSIKDIKELDGKSFDMFGAKANCSVNTIEADGKTTYDITADFGLDSDKPIYYAGIIALITGAIICAVLTVITIFGKKLAAALEKCNSPFEDSVLKAMKNFTIALIPLGICYVISAFTSGGISLTPVVLILAIVLFYFIFKYGAELQQESDETL